VIAYKKENEYKSIHASCFKSKLSMDVKNDGAAFGYLNVSSHVECFLEVFLVGLYDFYNQAIVIYKCLVVYTILPY